MQHRRLTTRRGVKRATIAVAHSLLTVSYCVLSRPEDYVDLGVNHVTHDAEQKVQKMVNRLRKLGYSVEFKDAA